MSQKGIVVGTVLALLALVAWVQLSDRGKGARIAPELDTPDANVAPDDAELQTASAVRGREPVANAAANAVVEQVKPVVAAEVASIPDAVTRLHGFVYDDSGAPLKGVTVYLYAHAARLDRCTSDSDGEWVLETAVLGERLVTAQKIGYASAEQVLSLSPGEPSVEHSFVLHALQLVRIDLLLPDGTPALIHQPDLFERGWNVIPVATKTDPGTTYDWGKPTRNLIASGAFWEPGVLGRNEVGPETIGFLALHDPPPLFVSLLASNNVLDKRLIDAETTEVVFTVAPSTWAQFEVRVTARVVAAEDGAPLECTAGLGRLPFMYPGQGRGFPTGQLEFESVLPGRSYLVVQAPGRAEVLREIEILPGQTVHLGEIRLHKPVSIRGRIVSAEDPLPVATLEWGRHDLTTGTIEWVHGQRMDSQKDGSFYFNKFEPGSWAIRAVGVDAKPVVPDPRLLSATVLVDASLGSVEGVKLELHKSSRVTLVTGKADHEINWTVRAVDDHGVFAAGARVGLDSSEADLHLPLGNFELELSRDGELIERRAVAVGSDSQRIDWPLE